MNAPKVGLSTARLPLPLQLQRLQSLRPNLRVLHLRRLRPYQVARRRRRLLLSLLRARRRCLRL